MINIIAAVAKNGVIGSKGRLPWKLKTDLARFKQLTMGNVVIFGFNTFSEFGSPLVGRYNIVLSKRSRDIRGVAVCSSVEQALEYAKPLDKEIFICGGENVYRESIALAERMYITHVDKDFEGDRHFPAIPNEFRLVSQEDAVEGDIKLSFCVYEK